MRILMVLGKATGGIGVHVDSLVADLREAGHRVEVLTDPLTARTFHWEDAHLLWPPGRVPLLAGAAARQARALARGAEVVHAHGYQAGLLALGVRGRTPLVVSLHNNVLPGAVPAPLGRLARRLLARGAALVTGASSDLVAEAAALGARAELAEVPSPRVPGQLDQPPLPRAERRAAARALLEELRAAGHAVDPELPLVLAVARIAPQKRIDVLLEAAQRLRGEANVVVVGGADAQLRERIVAADKAGDLVLLGPRNDLDELYRLADVLVLTSSWEARALVVQEAMAAGLPVVATDTGGIPDLLRVGAEVVGELVPVGDAPATAAAVTRLLRDPERAARTAARGREVAAGWPDRRESRADWERRYLQVSRREGMS